MALVLANTVFISAQSRSGEMSVLETVGLRKPQLMLLIAAEGIGLGVLGGMLGTGAVLLWLLLQPLTLGVEGHGIDLVPGVHTVVHCLLAALAIATVASLPPAFAASRRPLHLGIKEE